MDGAVEKSAMRKIYMRLLPFAILSYVLAYIDRINVSFAGLTMRGDLDMSAAAFGFAAGTFFWGYFIFEVPSNVILEKVGARLWIARIMISWGIIAGLTALVTGTMTFAVVRFLLGAANAPVYPLVAGVIANWFPVGRWAFPNACSSTGLALGQAAIGPVVTWLIVGRSLIAAEDERPQRLHHRRQRHALIAGEAVQRVRLRRVEREHRACEPRGSGRTRPTASRPSAVTSPPAATGWSRGATGIWSMRRRPTPPSCGS